MDKIAGPYVNTLTSILGDKRSTMLESELQHKPEMGKTKKRGYICYPGLMYTYGLPYPPKTESVALAMQGWPGTKTWCEKGKVKIKPRKKKKQPADRDFKALNRGAVDLGAVTTSELRSYRNVYDARVKSAEDDSLRRAPLIFPPDMVFGHPPRPQTPIGDIVEHKYQKCWIQQQVYDLLSHKQEQVILGRKPPKGAYRETRTSELRRYKEPIDPAPYWHMPRFTRYAKPHLDTFTWGDKERERAFYGNVSDSVPRQARFPVHRSGIYEPAKN